MESYAETICSKLNKANGSTWATCAYAPLRMGLTRRLWKAHGEVRTDAVLHSWMGVHAAVNDGEVVLLHKLRPDCCSGNVIPVDAKHITLPRFITEEKRDQRVRSGEEAKAKAIFQAALAVKQGVVFRSDPKLRQYRCCATLEAANMKFYVVFERYVGFVIQSCLVMHTPVCWYLSDWTEISSPFYMNHPTEASSSSAMLCSRNFSCTLRRSTERHLFFC